MLFRYKIKPVSPIMTSLMSDSLFGHFCWAVRYEKGEAYLEEFLLSYKTGVQPPVLFSSAVLSGYLPRPVLPPPKRRQMTDFVEKYFIRDPEGLFSGLTDKKRRFEGMNRIKEWSRCQLIPINAWQTLKAGYSDYKLQEIFYDQFKNYPSMNLAVSEEEITASNTINRISGSVLEDGGGLYSKEKIWFFPGVELDLYVETAEEETADLAKWFLESYLPVAGFGKDKSVGMGVLSIAEDTAFNPNDFKVDNPNACMALSLTAFDGMENYRGFYRLKTKFGKLGGDFAISSPTGGYPRPFKKPILMMEPGSVFFASEQINRQCLTGNVHSDARIRHCGLPVTIPLNIMEDE